MEEHENELVEVISIEAEKYMQYPYAGLQMFIGENHVESYDVTAPSGRTYEVQVASMWAKDPDGDIEVVVAACEKKAEGKPNPLAFCFVVGKDGTVPEESCQWKDEVPVAGEGKPGAKGGNGGRA